MISARRPGWYEPFWVRDPVATPGILHLWLDSPHNSFPVAGDMKHLGTHAEENEKQNFRHQRLKLCSHLLWALSGLC